MTEQEEKEMTREELLVIIDQAAREGWTELNLPGQGISELPAEIGQLTNLETLDLGPLHEEGQIRKNRLRELPDEIGQLANLQVLHVGRNQLTSLPEAIGKLSNLKTLWLRENPLRSLPESIGQLTNLRMLDLQSCEVESVPDAIGQLRNLSELNLHSNRLKELPKSIGQLTNLAELRIGYNPFRLVSDAIGRLTSLELLALHCTQLPAVPEWIVRLSDLKHLYLGDNLLSELPRWLSELANLESLYVQENALTSLPPSLARLQNLGELFLDDNPLNPALQSAYDAGLDELMAYLRSLEEAEPLHEAKLILVGEGGVGKTTLLKALVGREGEEPRDGEPTTHGVQIDIHALRLPHPEGKVEIQLNAWDFGGQEVYRVTHQFFFSRRSLYLLIWEPRRGVGQCQVEDWLRLIRLRVGDDARVLIVSTHCRTGERIARIDKAAFRRDFGSMLAGFLEVDSMVDDPASGEKVGIAELKQAIADAAAGLEHMGMPFNRNWTAARNELLAQSEPRISYERFGEVCASHGLERVDADTLAHLMHDIGYIVHYADDERLRDDVVLQPQWLTKAIGFVLEDRTTQEMDGILPDSRLREVWWDHSFQGEARYEPALYPFFLRLMERYDVSYRLPDGTASLVAQHVPQVRPDLPWLPEQVAPADQRRIAMICAMDEEPSGLVPWMIVRTHDYATELPDSDGQLHRLHWQRGMFLRNQPHGDAVLEQRGREFHIYAQAVWPQYFASLLRHTLQNLVTDNWPGLEGRYRFTVPCPEHTYGEPCRGRFNIDALQRFMAEGDQSIRCQECGNRQSIAKLLEGFEDVGLRQQLRDIRARLDGLDSRIANYVMTSMHDLADDAKRGPRLFTLEPVDEDWRIERQQAAPIRLRLQLWCEADGCQHKLFDDGAGVFEFDAPLEWVQKQMPYARFALDLLKTAVPVAAPATDAFFGEDTVKDWDYAAHLNLVETFLRKISDGSEVTEQPELRRGILSGAERSGMLAMHTLLRGLDPDRESLGLTRVLTYTGDYRWLCRRHYEASESSIPEQIEAVTEIDAFVSYEAVEPAVRRLQHLMKERGLRISSEKRRRFGPPTLREKARRISRRCRTVVILLGEGYIAPWATDQMLAFVNELNVRGTRVIWVQLPGTTQAPELPDGIRDGRFVNFGAGFRKEPMDELESLITGRWPDEVKGLTWIDWLEGTGPDDALKELVPSEFDLSVKPSAVRLRNIRSFADSGAVELVPEGNSSAGSENIPWNATLLLGDNSSGKSTMLQCITLASLGSERAQLAEDRAESLLRHGEEEGFIEVIFRLHDLKSGGLFFDEFCVGLKIQAGKNAYLPMENKELVLSKVNCVQRLNLLRQRTKDRFGFFCGYGAWRTMAGDPDMRASKVTVPVIDRVKSLFDPNYNLMDPDDLMKLLHGDLSFMRSGPTERLDDALCDKLEGHLTKLLPGLDGLVPESASSLSLHGTPVQVRHLSDGYSSLLSIAGHLFQHGLARGQWKCDPAEMHGALLIDEIGLHLHPSWQRVALPAICRLFPHLHVIATSHSPMVAGSVPTESIIVLRYEAGKSRIIRDFDSVRGWRADQILTSVLFDLPTTRDTKTEALMRKYAEKLNALGPEHEEVRELGAQVSEVLELEGEGKIDQKTYELLDQLLLERFQSLDEETRDLVLAKAGLMIAE